MHRRISDTSARRRAIALMRGLHCHLAASSTPELNGSDQVHLIEPATLSSGRRTRGALNGGNVSPIGASAELVHIRASGSRAYGLRSQDAKASSEQRNVSLPRGYNSPQDVRAELLRSHHVSLWRPLVLATLDLLSIAVAAVAMRATSRAPLVVTVPVALVLVLFVARQFRALECLVHEASHRNWTRGSQALNDALANVLAAWPVMSHVQDYRRFHQVHHAQLGSTQDADLLRWKRLDLERARQKPPLRFLVYAVRRLPSYVVGWWWAIGVDGATVCRFALWHAVPVVAVAVILSPEAAVTWAIAIAIPLLFVLPVLRFLGEIEEHRYDQVTSVLDATCTNIGFWQLLLLHPHGEAYHTVHHLYPAVPGYRIAHLHRLLMAEDMEGYGRRVPIRRAIFAAVNTAAVAPRAETQSDRRLR